MAKAIMIQGTMSNAGKSLLATGLCRVFAQDGHRVAPFKSQNMAHNSYITDDGLEMGRAQAVQAQAAGLSPQVCMNPILLKPVTNMGSQVIVNGEVLGNQSAAEYFRTKHTLLPVIREAYRTLDENYDIIVIEGAGSPAEINLNHQDIVNMGLARLVGAPVLLAGDIDRGGVFAQLYGTLALLPEKERALVKGLLINKFRGDANILRPGLSMLEGLTGKPVLGVLPMLDVDIEEEDSQSMRTGKQDAPLDIAVIRLPKISNFTDFAPLQASAECAVRYVTSVRELGKPDLLILPGTKSTLDDLRWLRQSGLEAAVMRLHTEGTPLLGICGGYQMLGRQIRDPLGVEGGGELAGMGLLPVVTEFLPQKHRTQTTATVCPLEGALTALSGVALSGYELHMGSTTLLAGGAPFALFPDGRTDGCRGENVYGSYLHGLFDAAGCRQALLEALLRRKGNNRSADAFDFDKYRAQQFDMLADGIRKHLDLPAIYRILEEGAGKEVAL